MICFIRNLSLLILFIVIFILAPVALCDQTENLEGHNFKGAISQSEDEKMDDKIRILIFGMSGTVGEAVAREFLNDKNFDVYGTYYKTIPDLFQEKSFQFDIADLEELDVILEDVKPDIVVSSVGGNFEKQLVFHKKLGEWLKNNNGVCYFCSTANVFDADPSIPHYEDDICSSVSGYGQFKIECEKKLLELLGNNLGIFRFSQVWGKDSPRMKDLLEKLEKKEVIQVYENAYQNRTTDKMLAAQIYYIITNRLTGIFHLGTEDLMSDKDFIKELIRELDCEDVKLDEVSLGDTNYYLAVLSKENNFPEYLRFKNKDVIEELSRN